MKKLIVLLAACLASSISFANHWVSENPGNYSLVMAVTGIIQIDGVEQFSSQLEVGAFCGDECRGSQMAAEFFLTNRYLVMLSIDGEIGNELTFKLYDHGLGQELNLTSPAVVTFNMDGYGNPIEPYILDFTSPEQSAFHFTTAGQWSDPSNWQGGALPGSNDEVFIDAACQLDMDATVGALTVNEGQSLTLQSGTTLTVTGELANAVATGLVITDGAQLVNASANVGATVEKDIVAYGPSNPDGWYTIASPMEGMEIEGSGFVTPNFDLYRYDETNLANAEWQNYKANHPDFITFETGRGYLYANSNTFSPAFTGTLNASEVTYPLTYTERPDALSGFNLIGNPFPHQIYKGAGGAIDNANLASGYYTLTNEGAWHVHTFEDAIQPGQGVLVKTVAATELKFGKTNAPASAENGSKASAGRLDVAVAGNGGEDRCFVYLSSGIGLEKMDGFSETVPSLWIRDNGCNFAITHIGSESETLDLMFKNQLAGTYALTVDVNVADFNYLHLIDHVTGADVDLLRQPTYTFHATGNEYEARFVLVFRQNTGIGEDGASAESTTFCFVKDNMLYFSIETGHAQVTLTDALGRVVKSAEVNGNGISLADLQAGLYVVRMVNGGATKTQKVIIN